MKTGVALRRTAAALALLIGMLAAAAAQSSLAVQRFDLFCPKSKLPGLQRRLSQDSVTIIDIESSATAAIVRVSMARRSFRRIFHAVLGTSHVTSSASDGYYDQVYLEDYTIPARYRGLITAIRLPDPQIE